MDKKDLLIDLLSQLKGSWEFSEVLIDEIRKGNVGDIELENLMNLLLDSAKKVELENKIIELSLSSEFNKILKEQEQLENKESDYLYLFINA